MDIDLIYNYELDELLDFCREKRLRLHFLKITFNEAFNACSLFRKFYKQSFLIKY